MRLAFCSLCRFCRMREHAPRGPRTPRGLPSVAAAPLYLDLRSREGGRLGVGCAVGVLLFVSVLQSAGTRPPRLRRCPPGLVGFLLGVVQNMKTCPPRLASLGAAPQNGGRSGEDLSVEVRVWRPHETHRSSRSSRTQNTDAQEATCSPHSGGQRRASARRGGHVLALCATYNKKPTSGGQRRRRGGRVTRSARHTTSHPASQKPRTRRQVCPPPEHEV